MNPLSMLDVLHAGLLKLVKRSHPYEGHKLSVTRWYEVLADPIFQQSCNESFAGRRRLLFAARRDPVHVITNRLVRLTNILSDGSPGLR